MPNHFTGRHRAEEMPPKPSLEELMLNEQKFKTKPRATKPLAVRGGPQEAPWPVPPQDGTGSPCLASLSVILCCHGTGEGLELDFLYPVPCSSQRPHDSFESCPQGRGHSAGVLGSSGEGSRDDSEGI